MAVWAALVASFLAVAVVFLRFVQTVSSIRRSVGWAILYPAWSVAGLILMGLGVAVAVLLVRRARAGRAKLAVTTVGAVQSVLLTVLGAIVFSAGLAFYPGPVPGVPG